MSGTVSIFEGSCALKRTRTATAQVFDHLREMIVTLSIMPGSPLPRAALSSYFAVSTMPVSSALLRLKDEGLVDMPPKSLAKVSRIDLAAARQAHFMRMSIELEMVDMLAACPPHGLEAELLAKVAKLRACLEANDRVRFARIDGDVFRTMYRAAGILPLHSTLSGASGHLERLNRLLLPVEHRAEEVIAQHIALGGCIVRQDVAAARQCVRARLRPASQLIERLLREFPDQVLPAEYPMTDRPA
jgi:DNA-binding GntR family transcriptional regulator